ncbi:MAG: carbamoyl-phosphate synthase (glutamine-hydrolyzing) large subunit, partial [Patescibacteria group bacterium]
MNLLKWYMLARGKKILLLGSGALKIGEAGEFDYAGSQAIKALKEEEMNVVLVNPNIATIQTSEGMADETYFVPVQADFVAKVIARERPHAILLGFGGQTALNCGLELHRRGILKKYNVRVLGTPIRSIELTEDRQQFADFLRKRHFSVPESHAATTVSAALKAATKIGYPVMVRSGFALGGLGSGIAKNEKQLRAIAVSAFAHVQQILVEECLSGWKEIEYEVVRDTADNCITVCNMENLDPLGIHTGESIVVAPSQTLTDKEYQMLRTTSIAVIRALGIVGECNIQYALDPHSNTYRIIEVNARLSRSSALASKATGYPLAAVAAKLSLGKTLPSLQNAVTETTPAFFEPALDYLVVKFPRWDFSKFQGADQRLGSQMKSVGEVMAIGRSFPEAIQKAVRMLDIGRNGIIGPRPETVSFSEAVVPTPLRIFHLARSLYHGESVKKLARATGIDPWFLDQIRSVVVLQRELARKRIRRVTPQILKTAKQHGFSDKQLAGLWKVPDDAVRSLRKKYRIVPSVKRIDTVAAEFPAKTNYLYFTYHAERSDDIVHAHPTAIVLGSGVYRIGSSVEFDWCAVNAAQELHRQGFRSVMVNCNPETVSTDYDVCDALYFEELTPERILDIVDVEKPIGVVVSVGGQVANNLVMTLAKHRVPLFGTSAREIDRAEDRHKFSTLLDRLNIDQPEWIEARSAKEAEAFAQRAGFPVLVRPSYVLSGSAMNVATNPGQLTRFLRQAVDVSPAHPVVLSKFEVDAREIDVDAVVQKGVIIASVVSEHVENAGVHSGDATLVLPPQKVYVETVQKVQAAVAHIARE